MGERVVWKCLVCGFEHEGAEPPSSCPVCGVGKDLFQAARSPSAAPQARPRVPDKGGASYLCLVCGYVHVGEEPPSSCPVCGVGKDLFQLVQEAAPARSRPKATRQVVILGAGVAGVSAAEVLADGYPDVGVTVVSREEGLPCYRLNLTPYLAGAVARDALPMHPATWYEERGIRRLEGEALHLDTGARTVVLTDGRRLSYDSLILATGARPFVPPLQGLPREGVTAIRRVADVDSLLARTHRSAEAVVLGGGLLGLEAAVALSRRGARVKVLESAPWLLPRQLVEPAARMLEQHVRDLGVDVVCGAQVVGVEGDESVREVVLAGGEQLAAQVVVLAVGIRPNLYLPTRAGLKVARGVVVDDEMRTSDPHVFAAGDVAEHRGALWGLWTTALEQGTVAGRNAGAPGSAMVRGRPESSRLKVVGLDVLSIGDFGGGDRAVVRSEDGRYYHLALGDGALIGANILGDPDISSRVVAAVEERRPAHDLADLFPEVSRV